jgi:hypothetical protein
MPVMKKAIHPLRFYSGLRWLDGSPLKILPYRQKIFSDVLYTFDDDGSLYYSLALLLRAKKNDKSLDGMLAEIYALCTWRPVGDFTGRIVAFDEGQADEDLDLFKKLVKANPMLLDALTIKQKSVERKDGRGFVEIIPGRDVLGQHGGKFDLLVIDEIHTQRNWDLMESLAPDPTRQSLTWITSYNSIHHKPLVPLFDMLRQAWAKSDPHMYFSYYAADRTTDPDFADKLPWERANPSMSSWTNKNYLEQQRLRLPAHKFRRLHENLPGLPEGSAFSVEKIDGAIERGVKVRPAENRFSYLAFVDMSGGSNDDACLAIAHRENGRAVLDLCINQGGHPPFDPMRAVISFAGVLKEYRVSRVTGDRYGGETFKAAFQKEAISYQVSVLSKHEIYEGIEVLFNTGGAALLDNETMESQFYGLVWRGTRIDHLPNEHDDFANAAAGAVHLAGMNKVINPAAVPCGPNGGIGLEIRRAGFGSEPLGSSSRLSRGITVRQGFDDDEEPAKVSETFRFRWGWGNDE